MTKRNVLGSLIRNRRLQLGLSQLEVAQRVGMFNTDLCNVEKGRYRLPYKYIGRMAKVLKIDPVKIAVALNK